MKRDEGGRDLAGGTGNGSGRVDQVLMADVAQLQLERRSQLRNDSVGFRLDPVPHKHVLHVIQEIDNDVLVVEFL